MTTDSCPGPGQTTTRQDHTHKCPATGCERREPARLLFCRAHWAMVPRPLQDEVLRTWKSGMLRDYWPARKAAVDAVNAQLAARDANETTDAGCLPGLGE